MARGDKEPKQTLCWSCGRATNAPGIGCSWSQYRDYRPVDGWDATLTINDNNIFENRRSYIVHACPLFLPEPERRVCFGEGEPTSLDKQGRWANRKRRYVEHDGKWYTVYELAHLAGKYPDRIYKRIRKGVLNSALSTTRPDPSACIGTSHMPIEETKEKRNINRAVWYIKLGCDWYTLAEICERFNIPKTRYHKRFVAKIQKGDLLAVKRTARPKSSETGVAFDWSMDGDTSFEEILDRMCLNCFLNV